MTRTRGCARSRTLPAHGAEHIADSLALAATQTHTKRDVAPLEYVRYLIDDIDPHGEGIAALHTQAHLVVVAIGEA